MQHTFAFIQLAIYLGKNIIDISRLNSQMVINDCRDFPGSVI
jgi:hypothetical protein